MKKAVKILFVWSISLCAAIFGAIGFYSYTLSDSYCIVAGERLVLGNENVISCNDFNKATSVQKSGVETVGKEKVSVKLFGIIPIKQVEVAVADETDVLVLGTPFGIKIYTEGVLVVGFSDVDTEDGNRNPSAEAGIRAGDSILSVNGEKIQSNSDMQKCVVGSGGKALAFEVKRGGDVFTVLVTPVMSKNEKCYKTGLWIRDSSAGIGTLTFYSPKYKVIAGLGHGICDANTGNVIPLSKGIIMDVSINGVTKGKIGTAGELKLYNVEKRDAAMVMAIVADKLGKPLNELRFISIREVTE